jgi:hypothetical protein
VARVDGVLCLQMLAPILPWLTDPGVPPNKRVQVSIRLGRATHYFFFLG